MTKKTGKILFLFSDTGGGHRSAVEALREALDLEYPGAIGSEMVDIFKDYAPPPLDRMPDWYPDMVGNRQLWSLGFRLSDGARRARLIQAGFWPYVRQSIRALVRHHPADLVVSAHPLAITPVLRALGENRPPFITVVTDLVSAHMFWYDRRVDLCIVPTEEAAQRAAAAGLKQERVQVVGLPVAERFTHPPGNKHELRARLEWETDRPVVLMVGGSEGMGPLEEIADALAQAGLPIMLVIVTGRNKDLLARLKGRSWPMPVKVYGFVHAMPDFMRAADILLTKAGPGTISEALIAGLPMVVYSQLPGQEEGNNTYVTDHGAGVWAPQPQQVVAAVRRWLERPELLEQARQACRELARPQAARKIARILAEALP